MARRNQSLFSQILRRIAGRDVVKRNRRAFVERTRTLRAEQLEARRVFAGLAFDSVIPLGEDVYASTVNDLVVASDGNRYVTGGFRGTVDFDPANTKADNSDLLTSFGDRGSIFVAKYFQDGSLAWARRMGSDTVGLVKTEWGRGIVVDEAGNSYVTGSFYSTAEFGDFSLSSAGGMDAFLVKLDPQGDVTWATSWGTTGTDSASSLIVAEDGNIVVGSSSPQLTNLHKFESANGSQHWAKSYGGDSLSVGVKLEEDESGNLLLTNSFGSNPIDVDPGTGVYLIDHGVGAQGTYVLKLNANAEFIWARTFETLASSPYGSAYPRDIAVDLTGAVIVAGTYRNLVDFNPAPNGYNPLPNVTERSFVTKLSASGELAWARDLEDSQVVVTDNDNNVYSFGKTLVSLAPSGIVRWEAGLRGSDGNSFTLRAAAITNDNRVVVGGHFTGTVDFDPAISEYNLTASAQTSYIQTLALDQGDVNLFPQTLFEDSFELSQLNGKWVQDSQNDWFQSTQRSTTGSNSAEVDGSATNATLTTANVVDLSGMASATLTFDWLIESGFDSGEYLSLDISTNGGSSWTQDVRRLNGNVSVENVWHSETVDLTPYKSADLKVRFRSKVSATDEDANVDNVRIVGIADGPNTAPVAVAGGPYSVNEGSSVVLSGAGSSDPDGSIASYAWDFDNDGEYDDASGVLVNFSTTVSGLHTVGLQVTDNRGATATTSTTVTVNNVAPTANAGSDVNGYVGTPVSLSANGSSDPGNDIVSYAWDLDNDGQYDDATGVNAQFTAALAGSYQVGVQVTDADGAISTDSALITIIEAPSEVVLFEDSFEVGEWNGLWVEDTQNDWFRSTQRATDGTRSAEVDGSATNATLTIAAPINLTGYAAAQLSFEWLIESGFDTGEYLALDISANGGTTWQNDVRRLNGNVSMEDVWHQETVNLMPYYSSNLKFRFRSTVSDSREDANVDNVKVVASSTVGGAAMASMSTPNIGNPLGTAITNSASESIVIVPEMLTPSTSIAAPSTSSSSIVIQPTQQPMLKTPMSSFAEAVDSALLGMEFTQDPFAYLSV